MDARGTVGRVAPAWGCGAASRWTRDQEPNIISAVSVAGSS
jgi:hypothetical protein